MITLLTGGTGFLGSHYQQYLAKKSDPVMILGRSKNSDIICDLACAIPQLKDNFDLVIHSAGLAHVSADKCPREFYNVNLNGTHNLLRALENSPPSHFIYISSVSVYGLDKGQNIEETAMPIPTSPYAKSKFQTELLLKQWCIDKNIVLTILRLPLIVGKNPPGNLGSLINSINRGRFFLVGKGNARRSMVLAEDVVSFSFNILNTGGTFNLTDKYHPSYLELSYTIAESLKLNRPKKLPEPAMAALARIFDITHKFTGINIPYSSEIHSKLTSSLTFSDVHAQAHGWNPKKVLDHPSLWATS